MRDISLLFICISLLFLSSQPLKSQKLDSLAHIWEDESAPPKVRFDAIVQYYKIQQFKLTGDSLLELAMRVDTIAKSLGTENALLKGKGMIASALKSEDSYYEAIKVLEPILDDYQNAEAVTKVYAYMILYKCYEYIKNYEKGLEYLNKSEKLFTREIDLHSPNKTATRIESLLSIKMNIISLNMKLKHHTDALKKMKENEEIFNQYDGAHKSVILGHFEFIKADLHRHFKEYDLASNACEKAVEYTTGNTFATIINQEQLQKLGAFKLNFLINVYLKLIDLAYEKGNFEEVPLLLSSVEILADTLDIPDTRAKELLAKGNYALKTKDYSSAIRFCGAGTIIAENNKLLSSEIDGVECLSLSYEAMGDYKNALNYTNKHRELIDSILHNEEVDRINELKINHQLEMYELETALKLEAQQQKMEQKNWIILLMGCMSCVVIFIALLLFKAYRKTKDLNSQLKILNKRIEQMIHSVSHDMMSSIDVAISGAVLAGISNENMHGQSINLVSSSLKSLKQYALQFLQTPFISDHLDQETTDPNELLEEIIEMFRVAINDKSVKMKRLPLPHLSLPPHILRQLFHNLMTNTLKHGLAIDGLPLISIYAQEAGGKEVQVIWENNGPKLTEIECKRIFEYQQGKNGRGLKLLKAVLEDHGYTIWAEPCEEKEGTRFVIEKEE